MYEWAVSMMRDRTGNKAQPVTKEQYDALNDTNEPEDKA